MITRLGRAIFFTVTKQQSPTGIGFYGAIIAVCLGGALCAFLFLPLLQTRIVDEDDKAALAGQQQAGADGSAGEPAGAAPSQPEAPATPETRVQVLVAPPGTELLVDGEPIGMAKPDPDQPHWALPFHLTGLAAGPHSFQLRYADARSDVVRRDIKTGENGRIALYLWLPNCIVVTEQGRKVFGMLEDETDAELVVSTTSDRCERFPKAEIKSRRLVDPVYLRGNSGVHVVDRGTDTPELIVDPFPGTRGRRERRQQRGNQ